MRPVVDITGQRFGHLTVVREHLREKRGVLWLCRCDCGGEAIARGHHLRQGLTGSCGCARRTHGQSRTKAFRVWVSMIRRCYSETDTAYKWYGARGIRVCDRWRGSFEAFVADMGEKPTARHSIDRVDNDGNYEPGNCRWATPSEQNSNRRQRAA